MRIIYVFLVLFAGNNKLQRLVEIPIMHHNEVYELSKLKITIVDASSKYVRAIFSDEEIRIVEGLGYKVKIIYEDYTQKAKDQLEKAGYHSYDEVITEMTNIAESYPDITLLDTIGYSVKGRLILGLKVSDNANVHEFEPGIRFTGCHHGNEHIATEVVLYLIHWLTDNYSVPSVKKLVDTREIWLIPMVSPDGVYHSTRHNANNVDPNRDYGYMWEGMGNSPAPFSQPETQAMRKNALENRFVLGFDYHSVATYVNALWDYSPIFSQDDTIMMDIGGEYADSTGYTLVRGWYWYSIHGSCQDAMYGCEGILDYTIETPDPDGSPIPVCENNLSAMLRMIQRAGDVGIAGIVTNSVTGESLDARVDIEEIHWPIYTDPRLGDYHRILLPGTYTIRIEANGYETKVIPGIEVSDSITRLDVGLVPCEKCYGHRIVWANVADPNNSYANHTLTCDALGISDSIFLSIGVGGDIVIDMNNYMIDSFAVYEGDDGVDNERYEISVSNNWNGPFTNLGIHYGTENFILLEKARYVRIVDNGDGNPDVAYAGFDLDGIEAFSVLGSEEDCKLQIADCRLFQNYPNPFTEKTIIQFTVGAISRLRFADRSLLLQIYDLTGRLVKTLFNSQLSTLNSQLSVIWDGKDESGKKVSTGIYFYRLKAGNYIVTRKLAFLK